jgi:hypothetical protein
VSYTDVETVKAELIGTKGGAFEEYEEFNAGYVSWPNLVLASNLFEAYADTQEKVPMLLKQFRDEYDFHQVVIPVSVGAYPRARGVETLDVTMQLVSSGGQESAQFTDIGPKSEWVDANQSASVDVSYDVVGGVVKLIGAVGGVKLPDGLPIPKAETKFTWKWNPKVGKVRSGAAGTKAEWHFSKSDGQWLDGGRELIVAIQRPRGVTSLSLTIVEARARFLFFPWTSDNIAAIQQHLQIPIRFKASAL